MTEERVTFRYVLGIIAIMGGLGGLAGLYFVPVPDGNREPLLLALGLVLGWGSTVMGYEFGSSPAGRKAADVGVRLAEVKPPTDVGDMTVDAETVNVTNKKP